MQVKFIQTERQEETRTDREAMEQFSIMWIQKGSFMKESCPEAIKNDNNRMELMAAIAALEALTKPCQVDLYSDSKYLVDAFNQHWIDSWLKKNWKRGKNEDVKNVDLWKRLLKAKELHQVTFHWVKGHADHPQNERCDQLATSAADGTELYEDEGLKQ